MNVVDGCVVVCVRWYVLHAQMMRTHDMTHMTCICAHMCAHMRMCTHVCRHAYVQTCVQTCVCRDAARCLALDADLAMAYRTYVAMPPHAMPYMHMSRCLIHVELGVSCVDVRHKKATHVWM